MSGDADVKTGWAYLEFATPVTVAKDDVYLFGVYHPNGVAARRLNAFTNDEVRRAIGQSHDYILDNIITPEVMDRIRAATMQDNDRRYMAYRLEYVAS